MRSTSDDPSCIVDFKLDGSTFISTAINPDDQDDWIEVVGTVEATSLEQVFSVTETCEDDAEVEIRNAAFAFVGFGN